MTRPAFQRQMTRLALFAMLLLALAPSVSRLLAAPGAAADGWAAVCSLQGLKWVKLPSGQPAPHGHDSGDCAYCPLSSGADDAVATLALPAAPDASRHISEASPPDPPSRSVYPSGLGSRGPPALS